MAELSKALYKKKRVRMYVADYIIYIFLSLFALITFYQLWYVIIGSFSNGQQYASGGVFLWPEGFTFANYEVIFRDTTFWTAFRNSVLRTATGVVVELLFTAAVAYAMTNKYLRCRNAYYWIFIFTMFFSGGIVPMYLLLRIIGLYDTFWVYILPSLASAYNVVLLRTYIESLPHELDEAVQIDGGTELQSYFLIILRVCMPVNAAVLLFSAISHWNSYIDTQFYNSMSTELYTLQYYLYQTLQANVAQSLEQAISQVADRASRVNTQTLKMAITVVTVFPIMCLYPFISRYFVSGLLIGSVKA